MNGHGLPARGAGRILQFIFHSRVAEPPTKRYGTVG